MNSTLLLEQHLVRLVTKEAKLPEIIDQSSFDYYLGVGCKWPDRILRLTWIPLFCFGPWVLMKYVEVPVWGVSLIGTIWGFSQATQRKITKLEASLELMELKKQFPLQDRSDD